MKFDSLIVRYGEISLKGRNRFMFEEALRQSIAAELKKQGQTAPDISVLRGRIYIRQLTIIPDLSKVLGVLSYSPACELTKDFAGLLLAVRDIIPEMTGRTSFRVRCQRVDKKFAPNSLEVERQTGALLYQATAIPVSLENPDFDLQIEIGERHIYLFYEKLAGFAGFPAGTAGQLVSLMSGGIDSPVATFMMMKRGVMPILLHIKVTEEEYCKVLLLKTRLEEYTAGKLIPLVVVSRDDLFFGKFSGLFNTRYEPYVCLICKYLMHKKAAEVAQEHGAHGVITGDNLAQVASQTLRNLQAQRSGSPFPIYSPLIAFEKTETIALARRIGTYDISTRKSVGCTPPHNPKTGSSTERLALILEELKLK
jgi:tRNA uracil 4-sulfurtransferase